MIKIFFVMIGNILVKSNDLRTVIMRKCKLQKEEFVVYVPVGTISSAGQY